MAGAVRDDADVNADPPPPADVPPDRRAAGRQPPVRTRAEVEARVAELAPTLRALGVERVRLFGSFVRGEQTEESDVDLLINFRYGPGAFHRFFDAIETVEDGLGRSVDILTEPSLSPYIGPHILREAEDVPFAG